MVTTSLVRWGNGQGVRLSKSVIEQSGLHINEELEVHVKDGAITLTPVRRRIISVPDFDALFANYRGPQSREDSFSNPVGDEL